MNNSCSTISEAGLYGISGDGNLFKPGTLTGTKPLLTQYPAGTYAYNPDRNNLAPSVGFAWQPPSQDRGLGRLICGSQDGDSVIRGGFGMAFQRPGMSDFTGVFGANQGLSVSLNRDQSTGNLGTLPRLLRDPGALTLATTPAVSYPAVPAITSSLNVFDSNLQMPNTQSYTVGWQRKLTNDTAFEVRYVGSRHRQDWETVNINEVSITDNGFLTKFRKAQVNLQANIAAGRGSTFAYTGAAGTSPLPTFLTFFQGLSAANAGGRHEVHHAVHQRDQPRVPRGDEPEPVRLCVGELGQRLRRQCRVPRQRHRGWPSGEPLPCEPGRARRHGQRLVRRQPDDQLRRHARELDSAGVPQAAVERPDVQHQLRLGQP